MMETLLYIFAVMVLLAILPLFFNLGRGAEGSVEDDQPQPFSYKAAPLLNKSEGALLELLDLSAVSVFGAGTRVMAQVSYGEFLKGEGRAAHSRINSKRADFLIVDEANQPVCVVEYQGAGHYGRGEAARARAIASDEIKRSACASAGLPFAEVPPEFSEKILRKLLQSAQK